MKTRMKSWVFWSSLIAQVLSLLVATGILPLSASNELNGIVASVLQIFVTFGVLNNPTDKTSF